MLTEFYAYQRFENPNKTAEEFEDENFDLDAVLADIEREDGGGEWETLTPTEKS